MEDWLCGGFAYLFAILMICKIAYSAYCLIELQLRWRSIWEVWSSDWLEIVHQIEREFKIALSQRDFKLHPAGVRAELTVGDLWTAVSAKLTVGRTTSTAEGYMRIVEILSSELEIPVEAVTPESRLWTDLLKWSGSY